MKITKNDPLQAAIAAIAPRFQSGNSVPVEKALVPAAEWNALLAALAVPEGWKLVSRRPSHSMIVAGGDTPGMRACDALVTFTQIRNGVPHPDIGTHWSTSPLAQAWAAMVDTCPGPHDLVSWQCETPPEEFQAPKLAQDWDEPVPPINTHGLPLLRRDQPVEYIEPPVLKWDADAVSTEAITSCQANQEGDCNHRQCPQLRDGEPSATGRSCPLWKTPEEF